MHFVVALLFEGAAAPPVFVGLEAVEHLVLFRTVAPRWTGMEAAPALVGAVAPATSFLVWAVVAPDLSVAALVSPLTVGCMVFLDSFELGVILIQGW